MLVLGLAAVLVLSGGKPSSTKDYRAWEGVYRVVEAREGCTTLRPVDLPLKYFALRSPPGWSIRTFGCAERAECEAITGKQMSSVSVSMAPVGLAPETVFANSMLGHAGEGAVLTGTDEYRGGDGTQCALVRSVGKLERTDGGLLLTREVYEVVVPDPGSKACGDIGPPAAEWPCRFRYEVRLAGPGAL